MIKHEWVNVGACMGFLCPNGVCLDLDNMTLRKVKFLAENLCKRYKLGGFLIVRSSRLCYHVVFDRYVSWRKVTTIISRVPECTRWLINQLPYGELCIRVSKKNMRNKPKIVKHSGTQHRVIADYLRVYDCCREW